MKNYITKLLSNPNIKQLIKFAFVGTIGTLVNLSVLYLLTELLGIYYIVSEIVGFLLSVLNNYLLNKIWTFKEEFEEKLVKKYFQYTTICILSLSVNLTALFILVEFYNLWYIYAEILAILCAFMINFLGSKFWTFNKNHSEINHT